MKINQLVVVGTIITWVLASILFCVIFSFPATFSFIFLMTPFWGLLPNCILENSLLDINLTITVGILLPLAFFLCFGIYTWRRGGRKSAILFAVLAGLVLSIGYIRTFYIMLAMMK